MSNVVSTESVASEKLALQRLYQWEARRPAGSC
jgi:hypothetical protein